MRVPGRAGPGVSGSLAGDGENGLWSVFAVTHRAMRARLGRDLVCAAVQDCKLRRKATASAAQGFGLDRVQGRVAGGMDWVDGV